MAPTGTAAISIYWWMRCPEQHCLISGGLQLALEDLLGVPVDVLTPKALPEKFRGRVLFEAVPL